MGAVTTGRRISSGVCHGTLGELFQGPVPYDGARPIGLVSFPVDRHSWVYYATEEACEGDSQPPADGYGPLPGRPKSAMAARLFLERHGRVLPPGRWSTHSELDVGVGMASSTADIVATLRCLYQLCSLPYDQNAVLDTLAVIERADSVFLDEFALYLSEQHRVVRPLGGAVGFHTAFVTEAGTVDTEAVTPLLRKHYRRRAAEYERCLTDLVKAFAAADVRAVARAATGSAVLSQEVLPKATFDAVLAQRDEFGADGVFVAHTGCLVGYLFAAPPGPGLKGELSAFFRALGYQCSFAQGGCR